MSEGSRDPRTARSAENLAVVEELWRGVAALMAAASGDAPLEAVLEAPEMQDAVAAMLETLDPHVELDLSEFEGWPEERVYRGRDGMLRFWQAYLTAWEEISWEFERFIAAGERVVVLLRQRARGRASGAWTVLPLYGQVWTLRDGRVVRLETYTDPAAALRAAGIYGSASEPRP